MTIDWNRFDRIWCIAYTGYSERHENLKKELDRVGITDSGKLMWKYTFPTIFNDILYEVTKNVLKRNNISTKTMQSCSLAHYSCIKTSYELGDDYVLILEDDIRFLKDLNRIGEILDDFPDDSDIVLYDTLPAYYGNVERDTAHYNKCLEDKVNSNYSRYDHFWSCGCYVLGRKAMRIFISLYEQSLYPADFYTTTLTDTAGLNRYFSVDSLACQLTFRKSNNVVGFGNNSMHNSYAIKKIDYSKYNIEDITDYDYGSLIPISETPIISFIIPMHNSASTIIRCIDSIISGIKNTRYEILCINDSSTDNTSEIIEEYVKERESVRLRLFTVDFGRAGKTRDFGVRNAIGKYIMFVDSDDEIVSENLESAISCAVDNGVDFVKFASLKIGADGKAVCDSFYSLKDVDRKHIGVKFITNEDTMQLSIPPTVWGAIYKREFIRENRIVSSDSICGNDIRFFLACRFKSRTFLISDICLYRYYFQTNGNTTSKRVDNVGIELENLKDCLRYFRFGNDWRFRYLIRWFTDDAKWHFGYCRDHAIDKTAVDTCEKEFFEYVTRETFVKKGIEYTKSIGLDILNPKTFQDKIGRIMVFDEDVKKTTCSDKLLMRKYCLDELGKDLTIPVLGVYDSFDDIDFTTLPDRFMLKCNHGCGYNIEVNKSQMNIGVMRDMVNSWMATDYSEKAFEYQYHRIDRKVFCEQYIGDSGKKLKDYKFFCFNGIPMFMEIADEVAGKLVINFYDMDFKPYGISNTSHPADYSFKFEKPESFSKMISISSKLSKKFDFVRVDFYENCGTLYIGELMFTPGAALFNYADKNDDTRIGRMLKLSI